MEDLGSRVPNTHDIVFGDDRLKAEEALLTRQFPETYPQYRRRVKAIIPVLY